MTKEEYIKITDERIEQLIESREVFTRAVRQVLREYDEATDRIVHKLIDGKERMLCSEEDEE